MRTTHYDTIIIGAGMSGLACASRLLKNEAYASGKRTLKVLESRDRIGGRINAVHVNGHRLDTGANWIHGTSRGDRPNPLIDILPDKKMEVMGSNVTARPRRVGDGEHESLIVPSEQAGRLFEEFWKLLSNIDEKAFAMPREMAETTTALSGVLQDEGFRNAFDDVPEEYHPVLEAIPQFMENIEAGPLVSESVKTEGTAENSTLALSEWAADDFEGEDLFLSDGYTPVLNEVGKDVVQGDYVNLDSRVTHIEWMASPIKVSTVSGMFTANTVVCTIPLGVLKWNTGGSPNASQLFSPGLPLAKQDAIDALGFGTLDKIFLVYKTAWWEEEPWASIIAPGVTEMSEDQDGRTDSSDSKPKAPDTFFGFTDKLPGFSVHPSGKVHSSPRLLSVVNLDRLAGIPVLLSFVSCRNAQVVEDMSDQEAANIVQSALNDWFGRSTPTPEAVHLTRWSKDPDSRGSYSHMLTGVSRLAHREQFEDCLTNEAGNRLRFAGEHTSVDHFATVHAALLSGWREADAILADEAEETVTK